MAWEGHRSDRRRFQRNSHVAPATNRMRRSLSHQSQLRMFEFAHFQNQYSPAIRIPMSAHPYAAAPPNPALVYDMADAYQQTSALKAAIDLDLRSPRPRLTVGSSRGLARQATLKGYLRRFAFAPCKIALRAFSGGNL